MKGIILAGGTGSRLFPLTSSVCKQILPVYNKPLIYYPLSVLMLSGIREVLIISTEADIGLFKKLFGDGSSLGMSFEYAVQKTPDGIAQAFLIGKDFTGSDDVCLILGDNIFYGQSFTELLKECVNDIAAKKCSSLIFGYGVKDPERYGVLSYDKENKVCGITEKPENPDSEYAVPGIYFFNSSVVEEASKIVPSSRGELEITDILKSYLNRNELKCRILGRGFVWMDAGTYESLLEAGNFIASIEKRQGFFVACIEEIAFINGWIGKEQVMKLADNYKNEYGKYLRELIISG